MSQVAEATPDRVVDVGLHVRIPADLREALAERAVTSERSISGEVRVALRKYLEQPTDRR